MIHLMLYCNLPYIKNSADIVKLYAAHDDLSLSHGGTMQDCSVHKIKKMNKKQIEG